MKRKIVGIAVLMLVATAVVSATNINIKENNNKIVNSGPYESTLFGWWGVDQKQTHQDGAGFWIVPIQTQTMAQSFTPTKDKLTAVSLYIFKYNATPDPVLITVSIRDNLTGSDLATKIIDTSVVTIINKGSWVLVDFEDISITPGSTYFIVCSGNKNFTTGVYCWFFAYNNTYIKGEGWIKQGETADWVTLNDFGYQEADMCFKTYFRKPLDISSVPQNNKMMQSCGNRGGLFTQLPSSTNINVKEKIQPTSFGADVPILAVGDSWTYNEQYINRGYTENGTVWMQWYHNCTSTYIVTDTTGDNYTVKLTSKNNEGRLTWGAMRLKFTPLTKLTGEFIFRKTDLAYVRDSYTEKGFVFTLIGKIGLPFPAQFSDTWGASYTPAGIVFPFPLIAGTNGTLANHSWAGHEKSSLYWGLIKMFDGDYSGYSGEQNYTCEMANITVPAGTYDAYNVSVESTFGLGHSIYWSYYAPEAGWFVKQYVYNEDEFGRPGWIFECELVNTTYTP